MTLPLPVTVVVSAGVNGLVIAGVLNRNWCVWVALMTAQQLMGFHVAMEIHTGHPIKNLVTSRVILLPLPRKYTNGC